MFETLFSPLQIGPVTVRNRVMHLATRTLLHDRNQVSDRLIAFFEERVRGGVGSIVLSQPRPAARHAEPVAYGRDTIPGLRLLAHAMHRSGVPIFGQLNDSGRQHRTDAIPFLQGPSPVPCPFSGGTPHEMTVDEIRAVTAGMVVSSRHLQEAGIDGVEIHGAQGHLLQQFLSPVSNHRTDAYGGSLANRLRFHLETLGGIRQACGPEFVIGLRLGVEEFTEGGLTFAEARLAAATIAATGLIDYLSISQANFNSIAKFTPDRRDPPMPYVRYPAGIRADRPGVPVVACGRILEPAQAEQILQNGQADLIGLCRPLLADADWARKAFEGHASEIRRCIGCNQCWSWTGAGRPIACVENPVTGRELELGGDTLRPVETPRRVVVVGGGPGGMEAARVAAMRGHRVTLFERETRLGGAVVDAAVVPSQADVGWLAEFLGDEMGRTGVEVRLGVEAGVDEVRAERPDAVIVACGAAEIRDGLGDTGAVPVHTPVEILRHTAAAGDHVVVLDEDGYYEGCAIAEFLAQRGARVHLVTRFFEVGREIPTTSLTTTLGALDRLGVELVPTAWLARVEGRDVRLAHYYSGREWSLRDVDSLVHVGGRSARNALYLALRGTLPEVRCVGDAYMPRRIADAVREGHAAGRTV